MAKAASTRDQKKAVIGKHAQHDKDTGSIQVQIALLTDHISALTEHLQTHKKDNHGRRGLLTSVSKRRKLLRHLQQTDESTYRSLVSELGIRS